VTNRSALLGMIIGRGLREKIVIREGGKYRWVKGMEIGEGFGNGCDRGREAEGGRRGGSD